MTALAALGGGLCATQLGPAALFVPPLRRRVWPALAGIGRPDHVALTFDDGPHPRSTPHFLRRLDAHRTQATFFLLATALARAPQLGREVVAAGHEIGVHGYDHRCLLREHPLATYRRLAHAVEVITELTGQRPRWFRPAYGVLTGSALAAARRLQLTPVLWTDWGFDWSARATADSVHATVTRGLAGGATVLLHDSDIAAAPGAWKATLAALPRVLDHCADRDLRVGPLRDHDIHPFPRRHQPWSPMTIGAPARDRTN
jgi:peptidoglycan/xylan/chitin deacetylase (PgdA/CDA1 family)